MFNIISVTVKQVNLSNFAHLIATTFFGLVHGFGFSNYFNMLMAEQESKIGPLLGFAAGIEVSQNYSGFGGFGFGIVTVKSIKNQTIELYCRYFHNSNCDNTTYALRNLSV